MEEEEIFRLLEEAIENGSNFDYDQIGSPEVEIVRESIISLQNKMKLAN